MTNDRLTGSSFKHLTIHIQNMLKLRAEYPARKIFVTIKCCRNSYPIFKESGDESRVPPTKVSNSAQGCNSILPREFELISKQMEPQDTSSGCWSGGSTIQGRGNTKNTGNTTVTPGVKRLVISKGRCYSHYP